MINEYHWHMLICSYFQGKIIIIVKVSVWKTWMICQCVVLTTDFDG